MKKKTYLFVAALCLFAGCGGGSGFKDGAGANSISEMEIRISPQSIRVGTPAQLSVTVILNSGEQFANLTTSFTDSGTGETLPIAWTSLNGIVAEIEEGALLVPIAPGSVTIEAKLMGTTKSRSIRIFDAYSQFEPSPDQAVVEGGEDAGERAGEGAPCNGHAVSVVSFSGGIGSGFGTDSLPDIVLGPPQGAGNVRGSAHVLSLGREGEIILDLGDCALVDGDGIDLIVFENAFLISGDPLNPYAELGAVAVSEDGITFTEFSCGGEEFPYTGCAGWNPVYSSPSNGISPFDAVAAGGDNFDLADIGVETAHYVRIRDLGTEGFGTSVGFDLDAISVVNGIRETP